MPKPKNNSLVRTRYEVFPEPDDEGAFYVNLYRRSKTGEISRNTIAELLTAYEAGRLVDVLASLGDRFLI